MSVAIATQRARTHSALAYVALIAFMCGAPMVMIASTSWTLWVIQALAPIGIWSFNLWFFGWAKMRSVAALLIVGQHQPNEDAALRFLHGRALTLGHPINTVRARWSLAPDPVTAIPRCTGAFETDAVVRVFSEDERSALLAAVTDGKPAQSLISMGFLGRIDVFADTQASRHETLALIAASEAAMAANAATPSHAPTRLERWFPGALTRLHLRAA